ncbi:hypothetical protein CVU76_01585 [Candidatus Dojkabacteria bacterium HGW-Dojkabacteria-1]|uniref:N-formylglutamate amidohydrolase n=1 Tax=Candidatus Dojkabacteria bacterium HGW-Dojkabacteria-1 TaxID=2013761 RepID=A0A2N2F3F2_9BACT|nr:MAG: hypothetical protein CVU76_01585 [Candidatus Dojkabacteria bacterium HGW-Dojkabacteria-1]
MPSKNYFKIIKGTNPILLSAPHVFSHKRPSLTPSYKLGEPWTDDIVYEICANTGAWGIVLTQETDTDPNYIPLKRNPYKQEITKIVQENKIIKFLDFHGLRNESEIDVGIYYPTRFQNSILLAETVSKALGKGKLRGINSCIFRFEDNGQETLGEYVATKLRVPSIQLEIARYIREDKILRNTFIENLSNIFRV